MPEERLDADLVLPLGVHAFVLDTTKGNVNVYVGPMKQPLSQKQEVPVVMNGSGRFETVSLDKAVKNNVLAAKGEYIVLRNPARESKSPRFGVSSTIDADGLLMGETINIPGPASFAPWPGQFADVVLGHHLKSNEYLLVRVYDEEAARKNWTKGTIKLVESQKPQVKLTSQEKDQVEDFFDEPGTPPKLPDAKVVAPVVEVKVSEINPDTLVIGQQLIIKGTEVSFYIPPTGVEVLKDDGKYVRQALTLERLEYCLLVDEDGNKRYVRGPEVVFPKPTETFKLNDDGQRKSRAYELNEISGLHVKVIAAYSDAFGVSHSEGEELFITGRRSARGEETTQIYFPRVEHALLKYSGHTRYHAVAIPAGEARYVMNRLNGVVRLEHGPSMFLPDPRNEVIVKRILSESESGTYYPGNDLVAKYNRELRAKNDEVDAAAALSGMPSYRTGHVDADITASSSATRGALLASRAGDVIDRGTKFTPPRTLVLDSKFEGAIQVRPWTGYAVQVVDQAGGRRVEVGPKTVQLAFDERLEVLSLSTGTPKTMDHPIKTVYLRVSNNAVSDVFEVKTQDLVPMKIHLKYLVRFDEDKKELWFNIDNYIQNMVDRFRSLVNNYARTVNVRTFYAEVGTLLRDLILGMRDEDEGRPGYVFEENGMLVYELDVLGAQILDAGIAESMRMLQVDRIKNTLEIERSASSLQLIVMRERNAREEAEAKHETAEDAHRRRMETTMFDIEVVDAKTKAEGALSLVRVEGTRRTAEVLYRVAEFEVNVVRLRRQEGDESLKADLDRRISFLIEEAKADRGRMELLQPQLTAALVALAQTGALSLVAQHLGNLAIVRDQSLGGMFETMFKGTPIAGLLDNLKSLGVGSELV